MEPHQAGITALITAFSRAYHAKHDTPIIFNDLLADQLFSPEERTFFEQQLSTLLKLIDPDLAFQYPVQEDALALVMQLQTAPITLSRSRYCEDMLEVALQEGVEQYVILGAGFDTFAFRRSDLGNSLQVYEVDHPFTQKMKLQRIGEAKWRFPDHLHMVPVDFSKDNLAASLIAGGFNPAKKSFFGWLGVTYYLTRQSIADTLNSLAKMASRGSLIVFDYMDMDGFNPDKACRGVQLMQTIAGQAGEPILTGFTPTELGSFIHSTGFDLLENLPPTEIEERYFQNRQDHYHAMENIHIAKAEIH